MPFLSPKGEPLQNPYELLKLQHGATDDEISRAFKKLMLQLHPDKQPVGQSAEEAEAVARLMHDVMDAKSFLLDGEYLAARRQYDSMLVLAKQQPPPLPSQQKKCAAVPQQTKVPAASQQTVPVAPQKQSVATSGSTGIHMSFTSKGRSDTIKELNRDGGMPLATEYGVTPSAKPLNNNLNVKRWGKVKRSRAIGRAAQAKKQDLIKKRNPLSTGKAFDGSCGDCSITDDNMASDDELRRTHTYSKTATVTNTTRTNINRPSASKTQQAIPKPSNYSNTGGKKNSHVSEEKNKYDAGIHSAPAYGRRRSECTRSIGRDNMNGVYQAVPKPTSRRRNSDIPIDSDPVILGSNKTVGDKKSQEASRRSSDIPELMKHGSKSTDFHSSCSTILLGKHYHCPLTQEIMKEPMCDAEGNNFERKAILKYLETHDKSPITGHALSIIDLSPNTALAEKIRLALETCLDSLPLANLFFGHTENGTQVNNKSQQHQEFKHKSMRDAVDGFIKDLNSGLPSISLSQLDSSGMTSFLYTDIKFRLDVPIGIANNVIIQTWYEDNKKAMEISTLVAKFNASLQRIGAGGRLTFRHMNGKYVFSLTKHMDPELFCKNSFRHGIEYFVEMSIKLHNIINPADVRTLEKVRLTNCVAI